MWSFSVIIADKNVVFLQERASVYFSWYWFWRDKVGKSALKKKPVKILRTESVKQGYFSFYNNTTLIIFSAHSDFLRGTRQWLTTSFKKVNMT